MLLPVGLPSAAGSRAPRRSRRRLGVGLHRAHRVGAALEELAARHRQGAQAGVERLRLHGDQRAGKGRGGQGRGEGGETNGMDMTESPLSNWVLESWTFRELR